MPKPDFDNPAVKNFFTSLVVLSAFCVTLSLTRFMLAANFRLWFLIWNLFLAWLPLIFAWFLYRRTHKHGLVWSKLNALFFGLWLLFLPNAFYLVTDFVHLSQFAKVEYMFDIVLLSSYAVCGLILGYSALAMVHKRALQRFGNKGHWLAVGALLASGFAIYLGRYLRWNSWDVIINPFGILFDVSERIINPTQYPLTFATTLLFFGFLSLVYLAVWRAIALAGAAKK